METRRQLSGWLVYWVLSKVTGASGIRRCGFPMVPQIQLDENALWQFNGTSAAEAVVDLAAFDCAARSRALSTQQISKPTSQI